jgi:hypothetical protein
MRHIYRYLLAAALIVSLSACSVTRHRPYSMDGTRLNVTMDDLEYLGETEISVDYRKYIGFISVIDAINGKVYDRVETKKLELSNVPEGLYRYLDRASYKLVEDFPEADYYIVTMQKISRTRLFLGSDITVRARIKAYRFK